MLKRVKTVEIVIVGNHAAPGNYHWCDAKNTEQVMVKMEGEPYIAQGELEGTAVVEWKC
jgi:hypothetical protein